MRSISAPTSGSAGWRGPLSLIIGGSVMSPTRSVDEKMIELRPWSRWMLNGRAGRPPP
jgi:hypothetical protein